MPNAVYRPVASSPEKHYRFSTFRDFFLLVGNIVWTVISSAFNAVFVTKPKKSLKGEVVLVTGAGNGLGRELALKFAEEGAILVLWDVDERGIQRVAAEINEEGGEAHVHVCDISDLSQVQRVGQKVLQEVGDVTVVVNNAGILQNVLFSNLDPAKIRKTLEVNILSHFWINKFFLPRMMANGKGHIVATASVAGLRGWLYLADYSASKFAILGMMEAMEEEMRFLGLDDKIHFTTVCPMTINTGMNQNPTTRLPSIVPILKVTETARIIVEAVQKNERLITVPRSLLYPLLFLRLFPRKIAQLVFDFAEYNMLPNSQEKSLSSS
ncbi:17-beta-hydroxysteroid dehydrogenase 13 like protein [Argiope bruennichi]|uniref:Short-chain dehydrogenase/reductase 3 n=1 Tax=Argiope bruennichi TaxID=94029 RepID=A0A8T0EFV5_ARGBR|nr:17-beta-hydroxysteroid dehydrogenase 13 like protein [Argiope bruennichi]